MFDEAELGRTHVGESGSLGGLGEHPLLVHLAIRIEAWSRALKTGGDNWAGTDVAIPVKANPCVELGVQVALALERQGPAHLP